MLDLLKAQFKPGIDAEVSVGTDGVRLSGKSEIFGQKFYGEQKQFVFTTDESFSMDDYFVLEYSCIGLRRQLLLRKPFIFAITDSGEEPLVCYDDITMDNRSHSVVVKTKNIDAKGIKIVYSIDRRRKADFVIRSMYTCKKAELPYCCKCSDGDAKNFTTIDISGYFNAQFDEDANEVMINSGRFFDKENVNLYNVPFAVKTSGMNMIAPPPPPAENDDIIMNFGVPAKRRVCRPISRDSLIEIPLDKKVTELYFVMSLSGMRHQRWGFATDGTILGAYTGDVTMPLYVDDTEGFLVEIVYADGKTDTALPMNLSCGKHGVLGDMGVYAVPADGSEVKSVIFHNRKLDSDLSLVALTVNETGERMMPELLNPEMPEKIQHKIGTEKKIALDGDILTIKNGAISMKVDVKDGLNLLEMTNDFIPNSSVKKTAMLKVRESDGNVVEKFELLSAKADESGAEISYKYGVLEFKITASLYEENDIKWDMVATNTSDAAIKTGIIFPCVSGINYASSTDNWYFFPKYQNIESNETTFIYEESAPSFPMQFLDVYSPSQQGGLAFTTQERDLVTRKYAFEKDEEGVSFYVEYPEIYGDIAAGESFVGAPSLFTAHEGDWRKSFLIYKKWLDSWYEPYKCQDKQWYKECFWLLAEIHDFFETEEMLKLPCWYNSEKKEFNFEKILEEQKEIAGCYPDILHMWSWTNQTTPEGKFSQSWGNFGTTDYDQYGGREAFKNELHRIQDEKGVKMSLYMHPTLLTDIYPQAEKFFPRHRVINDLGDFISLGQHTYRMCHANDEWRQHAIQMYPRVYKDLDIPLLYIDEWSLRIENRCYGADHGHSVPSSLLKTDRNFIQDLKDIMPEEVVLYGEYAAVDINARYIDCNISYYIIDSVVDMIETAWRAGDGEDGGLGRIFTNMYRFAFPKIVQLILPMAMRNLSWHPQKFMFFNAEAIYDSFWDNEESAGLDFTVKAYKLKKKYADCFTADEPEGMVDTLTPAICANKFPGKGRTVYTIYNRAYNTFRGKALKVEHIEGAEYYDAWNEKPLKVEIKDGYAEIYLEVDAQQMGCIEIKY